MEKELYEKYADKLLSAMKREGLLNKEVAAIFNVPASYMTGMDRHPENVPGPFMEKIRTWSLSGKPLRDYKLPEAPDVDAAAINQQKIDDAQRKFDSKMAVKRLVKEHRAEIAAAVAESVDTESTDNVSTTADVRQEIAAALREEYERQNPEPMPEPTPDSEMKIVAHKNGKVDVSRLDPRTGQVAAAELEFGDDGTFKLTYKFKS